MQTYGARGLGVLFRPEGVSLGAIAYSEIVVDPEGSADGVYVTTPEMTVATGAKAERIAASPEATKAFLLSPAGPGAYGVLP
ncbi:MAG: hypothetical protein AAGA55_02420 [Planctomycetota bacterium]